MISIVFPHAINKENDKCLELKLRMLQENTTCEYEVLYLANTGRRDLVYMGWDYLIRNAYFDFILWDNTDIVYAKNWNENVLKYSDKGDWIGLELVECGQIGSNQIVIDFGITADTFRRDEFEAFAEHKAKEAKFQWRDGFSWYSPSVWRKSWYIGLGGFDLDKQFPYPCDIDFRRKAERDRARFIVANSWAYHFQRAGENLGEKPERVSKCRTDENIINTDIIST